MDKLSKLRARAEQIQARAGELKTLSDERDLNAEEITEAQALSTEFDEVEVQIDASTRMAGLASAASSEDSGRKTSPPRIERVDGPYDAYMAKRGGFDSLGSFAMAVAQAGLPGADAAVKDKLAKSQPTNWSGTGTPADGGYAVPPDFREIIVKHVLGENTLLGRTDQYATANNTVTIPKDETTPWQSTGGLLSYWVAEGAAITDSKVALLQSQVALHKVAALVPCSEELLSDSPMIESYIAGKVPDKMNWMVDDAILNGDGSGKPTGVFGHASTVTVTRNTDSVVLFEDIIAMWAALYPRRRQGAIWLCNSDVESQLLAMAFDASATSKVPVWLPGQNIASSPFMTVLGLPVVTHEACGALGSGTELLLWQPQGYFSVIKAGGGMRSDVSIHLYFDHDITTFRFIMRVGGEPWLDAPITRNDGSSTWGYAVQLSADTP